MKSTLLLAYLLFMIPQTGKTLEDYRWKNRLVIMNFDNPTLDSLLIGASKNVKERKLLFVEFNKGGFVDSSGDDKIDKADFFKALTQRNYQAEWVLIGLDGGVKYSGKQREFSLDKIYSLIDQMPMRQSEID